jgi:SET domain-containing protein
MCYVTGRGVFAVREICKSEFIVEYKGELVSDKEANEREQQTDSVFRYFFRFNNKKLW